MTLQPQRMRAVGPSASQASPADEGSGGPLRAVLAALERGAPSLDEVAAATGLARDVVSAAVTHLVRLGRLSSEELAVGCPTGGCGTCPSGSDGRPGCGAAAPSPQRRGPVLVTISMR